MTDSTMVERLALVFAQHGDHFFDNDGPSNASWDDFSPREQLVATAAARAAIEAMMAPTQQMVDAGALMDANSHQLKRTLVASSIYTAMLRSSLKGEGE